MDNIILEFLEAYKCLDELCKQILLSNQGISEYIKEMSNERQGYIMIACWERDLKQLKKMRWMRNQLVHEPDSFRDNLVNVGDIEWLKDFHSRIMECTDPFSLLNQSKKIKKKTSQKDKTFEKHLQRKEPSGNQKIMREDIIFIIILGMIFFIGICLSKLI